MYKKKLIRIHNSVAIIIPKPIVEMLDFKPGEEVDFIMLENRIQITKLKSISRPVPLKIEKASFTRKDDD